MPYRCRCPHAICSLSLSLVFPERLVPTRPSLAYPIPLCLHVTSRWYRAKLYVQFQALFLVPSPKNFQFYSSERQKNPPSHHLTPHAITIHLCSCFYSPRYSPTFPKPLPPSLQFYPSLFPSSLLLPFHHLLELYTSPLPQF